MCIRDRYQRRVRGDIMADMSASEEAAFPHDRVETIINKHVEATIENNPYSESAVPRWIQTISENVTQDLIALNKPFKYVGDSQPPRLELAILTVCCCCVCFPVNCIVMEQCGAGINTANSAYWDSVHDGVKIVQWPTDRSKNQTVTSITSVYGIAM
eukprot:TRINITY_DN965_c0_g1_i1.p1 TRINITY_DN965_c0_g1~~TRINITY_DN965_c0_g1_i1.p1  ORF type:complete len:157 (-),score=31.42 TRINITY_DN965_c0_g1_i1:562-1032(-)